MGDGYDRSRRFSVRWKDEEGVRKVWVQGEVDLAAVDGFRSALAGLRERVEVDLSEVTFMDLSGLSCLLDVAGAKHVELVATSERVDRLLELTQTAGEFDVR